MIGRKPTTRFAAVSPKRLSDNAVMRNAFKRNIFHVIKQQLKKFGQLPYTAYVIFPKVHLRTISREHVEKDIEAFLAREYRS